MSCGCQVFAEFRDARCLDPLNPVEPDLSEGKDAKPTAKQEFRFCKKHDKASDKTMLEFVLSERMYEVIEEAHKPPVLRPAVTAQNVNLDNTEGDTVQRVATVAGAANRPRRPPGVKTISRSAEQLTKVGAVPTQPAVPDDEIELGNTGGSVDAIDQFLADQDAPVQPIKGPVVPIDDLLGEHDPSEQRVVGAAD